MSTGRFAHSAWGFARSALVGGVSNAAAAAAFFTSLAILPMMLTVASFLRAVRPILGPDASLGVKQGFANLLRIVLTARGSSAADAASRLVTGSSHSLLTIGSLVSLLVLTRAFRCVLDGLGDISAPSDGAPRRRGYRRWLWSLLLAAVTVGGGGLAISLIAVGPLLGHARGLVTGASSVTTVIWIVARWPLGALLLTAFITLVQRIGLSAPCRAVPVPWRHRLVGAAATSLAWIGITLLLPVYVHVAHNSSPTLGVLGGGLILLLWAYLLMATLFLGALLSVALGGVQTSAKQAG